MHVLVFYRLLNWKMHGETLKKICTGIYCVLYCLYCVFVLFPLCIFILICFVCTSVRTTATEWQLNCSSNNNNNNNNNNPYWRTRMRLHAENELTETEDIKIQCGIFQGDSLFCICLIPLTEQLNRLNAGYEEHMTKIKI